MYPYLSTLAPLLEGHSIYCLDTWTLKPKKSHSSLIESLTGALKQKKKKKKRPLENPLEEPFIKGALRDYIAMPIRRTILGGGGGALTQDLPPFRLRTLATVAT